VKIVTRLLSPARWTDNGGMLLDENGRKVEVAAATQEPSAVYWVQLWEMWNLWVRLIQSSR
jgi:hypothetical protein